MSNSTKGTIFALFTSICWSLSGVFVKLVNQSAYVIAGFEGLIGLLFMLYVQKGKVRLTPFVLVVGFCQFMMHITFILANQLCSVGNVIVLQYSSMIFVLLYQSIDKKIKPLPYQLLVIVTSIVGMVVFFYDSFTFKGLLGNVLSIVSGAFFGLQFYLNTKAQAHPESSNTIQFLLGFLCMPIYLLVTKDVHFSLNEVFILFVAGIIEGALAGLFFAKCITLISAFSANVICMSEIVFAPFWAFFFLGETFTLVSFVGAVIIVSALLFNKYKEYSLLVEC